MNTKKLIGAILGVLMFGALIAGATFAWLTFTANVTNNVVNLTTGSFTFTYTNPVGSNLTSLLPIAGMPKRNALAGGSGYITLTATKPANSPYASSFQIILNKTNWGVTTANAIKYAVCRSTTAANCNNSVATTIPTTATSEWVKVGEVVPTGNGEFVLFDDTTTTYNTGNSPFKATGSATGYYYVYIWIDASVITSDNMDGIDGKTVNGYIYAKATQGE